MKKTLEECHATAMLMGGWYDQMDHTINIPKELSMPGMFDPDTMEPIEEWGPRIGQVRRGEIGFKDNEVEEVDPWITRPITSYRK